MSRSNYDDDGESGWATICWRGAVKSAIRGVRGQALLKEMLDALDAMPEKALVAFELEAAGSYCALGVVGAKRGIDLKAIDPEDYNKVALTFGVSPALAREIVWVNDEAGPWTHNETPAERWVRVRKWVADQIVNPVALEAAKAFGSGPLVLQGERP